MRDGSRGLRGKKGMVVFGALALALAVAAAACGGGGGGTSAPATSAAPPATSAAPETTPPATSGGSETTAAASANVEQPGQCGAPDKQGQAATGDPIKLGAIITKQPGIDFSSISDIANAYFKCVNANGGINGRPIEYDVQYEQTDPQQVAQLAVKLIENDKVLGLVGSTSLIDCPVNHKYYESKGYYVIEAGVPAECFTTPNMAPVNMGPRISMTGITAYAIAQGAKKVVEYNPNNPGVEYYAEGPLAYAKTQGIPGVSILGPQVIQDPASEAQKLVQAAGPDGAVLIDYVAPEALKILNAVAQQGLIDKVKMWGAGGASYDASLISALGSEWNGKYPINVELSSNPDAPDNQLLKQLISQYAPKVPYSAFAQLGFMAGKFATEALLRMPAGTEINAQTVNEAFHSLKNVTTDILCKPWYFGDLPAHQPINTARTVNIQDKQAVEVQGCTDVPAEGDPVLQATRAAEQAQGLNTGS